MSEQGVMQEEVECGQKPRRLRSDVEALLVAQRDGPVKLRQTEKLQTQFSEESPGPFTDALRSLIASYGDRPSGSACHWSRTKDRLYYCRRAPKQPPISHPGNAHLMATSA